MDNWSEGLTKIIVRKSFADKCGDAVVNTAGSSSTSMDGWMDG